MRSTLTTVCLLSMFMAFAQDRKEFFDMSFHPNETSPYYYVLTTKKGMQWEQEAYYISTLKLARRCTFKDESCATPDGSYISYDIDGHLKENGTYKDGKKDGAWFGYNESGLIVDSGMYVSGRLKGVRMEWYDNGMPRDSMNFDGAGNGVQVSWYNDGSLASAGYWTQDTLKRGRWKYFHKDGTVKATEDYVNGNMSVCNCYTEKGEAIDTALCREKESKPAGSDKEWVRFLQKNLVQLVMNLASNGVKPGNYSVVIKFVVLEDGSLSEFSPLTRYGHGIEDQVIKVLRSAPKWEPGRLFGQPVKSYHTQPITFVIQN
ncbi:MAG: hypothetical protein ACXVLT_15485 [Flavisolibacter sp.]